MHKEDWTLLQAYLLLRISGLGSCLTELGLFIAKMGLRLTRASTREARMELEKLK